MVRESFSCRVRGHSRPDWSSPPKPADSGQTRRLHSSDPCCITDRVCVVPDRGDQGFEGGGGGLGERVQPERAGEQRTAAGAGTASGAAGEARVATEPCKVGAGANVFPGRKPTAWRVTSGFEPYRRTPKRKGANMTLFQWILVLEVGAIALACLKMLLK